MKKQEENTGFAIVSPSPAALRAGRAGVSLRSCRSSPGSGTAPGPGLRAGRDRQGGSSHGCCSFCPPCGSVKAELLPLYPWALVFSWEVGEKGLRQHKEQTDLLTAPKAGSLRSWLCSLTGSKVLVQAKAGAAELWAGRRVKPAECKHCDLISLCLRQGSCISEGACSHDFNSE